MKRITCELCGSAEVVKQDGVFVCQSCGAKYTLDEAKQLLKDVPSNEAEDIETKSKPKKRVAKKTSEQNDLLHSVDGSEVELNKLYTLARRAVDENTLEDGIKYYEKILREKPDDWEARFYVAYCRAGSCRVGDIVKVSNSLQKTIEPVLKKIKSSCSVSDAKANARVVYKKTSGMAVLLYNNGLAHWQGRHGESIGDDNLYTFNSAKDFCRAARTLMFTLGESLQKVFGSALSSQVVSAMKDCLRMDFAGYETESDLYIYNTAIKTIKKHEPSFREPFVFKLWLHSLPMWIQITLLIIALAAVFAILILIFE